jgi:hypothetical protein
VGTMAVVVPHVAVEDAKEVAAAGDQEMVQAFPAQGTDPALGNGVGVRGLDRRTDDLRTNRAPDVIEGPDELAVAVADQEPEAGLLIKRAKEIPGLLGDPHAGGVGGDTSEVDSSAVQLDEEQHLEPLQEHGIHGEEVTGHDGGCLPAQKRRQVVEAGRGAGWIPFARRTLAMELAETWKPRRSSSPRMRW